LAVLVASGSMSPTHRGHVHMLWQARARLEVAGYAVLAGWLSPSGDLLRLGKSYLQDEFRERVAELSVVDDDFVSVGTLELRNGQKPTEPADVASALQSAVMTRFRATLSRKNLHVFYVCGSDAARKHRVCKGLLPAEALGVVMVPRDGPDYRLEIPYQLVMVAEHTPGESAAFSSKKLREAFRQGDTSLVARMMMPAAARFALSPTALEMHAMQASFDALGIKIPGGEATSHMRQR